MELVLLAIINTFISYITEKFIDQGLKIRKNKLRRKLIKEIELSILNTYGNELFYNELSRLICSNNILEHIFSHCYDSNSSVFATKKEHIEYIINKGKFEDIQRNNAHDAIKYIFDKLFYVLNKPEYDESRKIINQVLEAKGELLEGQKAIRQDLKEGFKSIQNIHTKQYQNNPFAENDFCYSNVVELVDNYDVENALNEISKALEEKDNLGLEQIEQLYYQRARIYINTNQYQSLEKVKRDIIRINKNSIYACMIDYYIACKNKDTEQFNKTMKIFSESGYTNIELSEKKVNFYLNTGEFEKIKSEIIFNDEIKQHLQGSSEINFAYGCLCLFEGDLNKAKSHFDSAYSEKKYLVYKYNSIVCDYYIWAENVKTINDYNKSATEAEKIINDFNSMTHLTDYFSNSDLTNYWIQLFDLHTFVSPEKALEAYKDIPENIHDNEVLLGIKAKALVINTNYAEAERVFQPIWNHNVENISNLFITYLSLSKYSEVIDKFNIIDNKDKENPYISSLYLTAKCNYEGYAKVKPEITKLIDKYSDNHLFLIDMLDIYLEYDDKQVITHLDKIRLLTLSNLELRIISKKLISRQNYMECCYFIENCNDIDEELFVLYHTAFNSIVVKTDEMKENYYNKVKVMYSNGLRFKPLLISKSMIELELNLLNRSIITLEEYKKLYGIDESYSYYYIISKIKIGDSSDCSDEIATLLQDGSPEYLQAAARMKALQGNWSEAKTLARKSLYMMYHDFREDILINYIMFFFSNVDKEQKDVTFEKVYEDSVVHLSSDKGKRKIAIHNDESLLKQQGIEMFDCENVSSNSKIGLLLISQGNVGDSLSIDKVKYKIELVEDVFGYLFRYCLNRVETFKHKSFQIIKSDTIEGFRDKVSKILKDRKDEKERLLDLYNLKTGIGAPVSFLSGTSLYEYYKAILWLLHTDGQHFLTGEMCVFENVKYVLSLSSIIVLQQFNMLEKITKISDKISITKQTEDGIRIALKEANKQAKINHGYMSLDDGGNICAMMYNESDKVAEISFWANILSIITNFDVEEVAIEDNEIYSSLESYLMISDISSIELSRKQDKILISDDLFIRKMCNSVYKEGKTNNSLGVLTNEGILLGLEYLDLILELASKKYLYCIDYINLIMLIGMISTIEQTDLKQESYIKLKKIVSNVMDDTSRAFYQNMVRDAFQFDEKNGGIIYTLCDLFYEPLGLKPKEEVVSDMLKSLFPIDDLE